MLIRSTIIATLLAGAAMSGAFAQPTETSSAPAPCGDALNMRVYFSSGSSTLDPIATEMLRTAERQMAECDYAELHVMVAPSSLARARGQAILARANDDVWDVAQVHRTQMTQRAAVTAAPDYVDVAMTTYELDVDEPMDEPQAAPAVGI